MTDASLPRPGWFPDPAGGPDLRWWDGAAWFNATHPRPGHISETPSPVATAPLAQPAGADLWRPVTGDGGNDVAPYPDLFQSVDDEAPTPRSSTRSVWVAVIALVTLVALAGLAANALISAMSGPSRLDTRAIEARVTGELTAQTGAGVTVTCPHSVTIAADTTVTCTATTDDGSTATIVVRQVDDQGNVRWHVSG